MGKRNGKYSACLRSGSSWTIICHSICFDQRSSTHHQFVPFFQPSVSCLESTKSSVAKANKTSSKPKQGGGTNGKLAEVVDKILSFLFEMYEMGTTVVKEDQVLKESGYARTDSTGYRAAMKEVIKNLGYVQKSAGTMSLTEEGLKYMSSKQGNTATKTPTTNKEVEESLKKRIMKFSKGKAPQKALDAIWDVLKDNDEHERDELVAAGGYKRPDSTGYREIMKWMKQLDVVEQPSTGKKGMFKFNSKTVYPFDK